MGNASQVLLSYGVSNYAKFFIFWTFLDTCGILPFFSRKRRDPFSSLIWPLLQPILTLLPSMFRSISTGAQIFTSEPLLFQHWGECWPQITTETISKIRASFGLSGTFTAFQLGICSKLLKVHAPAYARAWTKSYFCMPWARNYDLRGDRQQHYFCLLTPMYNNRTRNKG